MASASRVVFFGADRDPSVLYEEVPVPEIQEGEILAKVLLATICGSDLHTISGKRVEAIPSVLGHEAVAEVIETRRTGHIRVGDRITFSVADSCGNCTRCQHDLPQKCHKLTKYGHLTLNVNSGFNGCYSTHIVLLPGTAVYKIPDNVSDAVAAPINCALATVVNALCTLPRDSKHKVAVVQGAGLLGLYACAMLRERGFRKVYCTDINQNRLNMVPNFGAIPICTGLMHFEDVPDDGSVDVVLEVCGSAKVVRQGFQLLRPGGTYIFAGLVHPDSNLHLTADYLIRKCLTIKGVHNYAPIHLEEAVQFVAATAHKYPYQDLVSPPYTLKDFHSALQAAMSQAYFRVSVKP